MSCFGYLREKARGWRELPYRRRSAPAISDPVSNVDTVLSDDSVAARQISKSSGSVPSPHSLPALYEQRGHNLRVFDLKELRNATNDFSRLLKIGEGGFGCVYRGFVKSFDGRGDKKLVAIKKLNPNGLQGHKQWVAEVHFLGVVEHPNLVKLIGYCSVDGGRGTERLLVYEFVANRTLEEHLFNRAYPTLPWHTRLKIALAAAQGLAYLHEGMEIQVIYRDFKASNVLLDEEFEPKLSDFGLAREGPAAGNTHVSTAVMGTYGYAAPDYVETGRLTSKSDVWSFGVVLYEILTGRRTVDRNRPRYEHKLLDWVMQFPVEGKTFSRIMDPRLENQYSLKGAREVAKLANCCLLKQAKDRPKMSGVVESLKRAMEFTAMVTPDELSGEDDSKVDIFAEKRDKEGNGSTESFKRRMLHLAKLRESANNVGARKYTITRAANST